MGLIRSEANVAIRQEMAALLRFVTTLSDTDLGDMSVCSSDGTAAVVDFIRGCIPGEPPYSFRVGKAWRILHEYCTNNQATYPL